jgi:hypothetical protein
MPTFFVIVLPSIAMPVVPRPMPIISMSSALAVKPLNWLRRMPTFETGVALLA